MTDPVGERPHMPDYGVDTDQWQPLPWSWAAQRLAAAHNYWVVSVSASGRPHALPVWGVWNDDEHRFFFSCGPNARKARNIAENPRVCVASEDTVEAISLEGTAATVTQRRRQDEWIERYLAKYSSGVSAGFLRANLMVEVTPERAFGIIEREEEFSTRATRWRLS